RSSRDAAGGGARPAGCRPPLLLFQFLLDYEGPIKMTTGKRLAGLLLLTTALAWPGMAQAQETDTDTDTDTQAVVPDQPGDELESDTEISIPGGAIIVTGRVSRDPTRSSSQVLSVLSSEQIARTGEGNIAGALGRVTGLSVVGPGYVYVDRKSTRLNSSHVKISYAVFCLKKKKTDN